MLSPSEGRSLGGMFLQGLSPSEGRLLGGIDETAAFGYPPLEDVLSVLMAVFSVLTAVTVGFV
jgi:hypothetical protein